CCLPILIWNIQNGWVTFLHVKALSVGNASEPSQWHWSGPLIYLGGQCGLYLVFWFVAWGCAMVVHHPLQEMNRDVRYLWWMSAPMFLLFLGFSVKTRGGEMNWPVTAYLSGFLLTAAWLVSQAESTRVWVRRWTLAMLTLTCALGLVLSFVMHRAE